MLHRFALVLAAVFSIASFGPVSARELTLDDVLDLSRIEDVAPSPDGDTVAVVMSRPARAGEVYGRTYHETDVSRNDVWLVPRRGGPGRNLTNGLKDAAGYWCATWSPDGNRLAMLSTQPELGEPRGGDNVRLYIWDRRSGQLKRAMQAAAVTQTHYGSPMYRLDLRGGADHNATAHRCSDEENAPFIWLDADRLLVLALPLGKISGLIDEQGRVDREQAATVEHIRRGDVPTVTSVGSGLERVELGPESTADLGVLDLRTDMFTKFATVPEYPFRGETTIVVAPDGTQAAVLATVGAVAPGQASDDPNAEDDSWTVQKRLGFVDLAGNTGVRWIDLPKAASYPLELFGWSSRDEVALRARAGPAARSAALFTASRISGIESQGDCSVGQLAAGQIDHDATVLWAGESLLVLGRCERKDLLPDKGNARPDWWLIRTNEPPINLTQSMKTVPTGFRQSMDGSLFAFQDGTLLKLNPAEGKLITSARMPTGFETQMLWPEKAGTLVDQVLVGKTIGDGVRSVSTISSATGRVTDLGYRLSDRDRIFAFDAKGVLIRTQSNRGLLLRSVGPSGVADLIEADRYLDGITWGKSQTISYRGADGRELKAAVILPPGFDKGHRYPVLTWVYPGMAPGAFGYWLDPYMPGIYNLQLYAAQGYIVLVPQIPMRHEAGRPALHFDVSEGVLPAIDRLVAIGYADPERIGVFGQSMGGYAVDTIVTQTSRFKAAVAIAGPTDLPAFASAFDPTARGYDGIEHERSYNWYMFTYGGGPSVADDLWGYRKDSPLEYADRIHTPLLLIHGERDARAPLSQAEALFNRIYRQGGTARLSRYWGENHALARSPANVRNIFRETLSWFGKYMPLADTAEFGRTKPLNGG